MAQPYFGRASAVRVSTILEKLRKDVAQVPQQPALRRLEPQEIATAAKEKHERLDLDSYSEEQMFALMNMSADHRHQAIWHYARLNLFTAPPFTRSTFFELSERGLACKPEGSNYHRLTPQASELADACADKLMRRYKIHAPILVHTRGQIAKHVTFRCTCGYSCALTAGNNMQLKASKAFTRHLVTVNAVDRLGSALAPRHFDEG